MKKYEVNGGTPRYLHEACCRAILNLYDQPGNTVPNNLKEEVDCLEKVMHEFLVNKDMLARQWPYSKRERQRIRALLDYELDGDYVVFKRKFLGS
jgi:hypothetical protein